MATKINGFSSARSAFINDLLKKNFSRNGANAIYKYAMKANDIDDNLLDEETTYNILRSTINCYYEYKDIDDALDTYGYDSIEDLEYSSVIIPAKNCVVLYINE